MGDNTLVHTYRTYSQPVGTSGLLTGSIIIAVILIMAIAVILTCRSEAKAARAKVNHDHSS